jgi:hypothetical protein
LSFVSTASFFGGQQMYSTPKFWSPFTVCFDGWYLFAWSSRGRYSRHLLSVADCGRCATHHVERLVAEVAVLTVWRRGGGGGER